MINPDKGRVKRKAGKATQIYDQREFLEVYPDGKAQYVFEALTPDGKPSGYFVDVSQDPNDPFGCFNHSTDPPPTHLIICTVRRGTEHGQSVLQATFELIPTGHPIPPYENCIKKSLFSHTTFTESRYYR